MKIGIITFSLSNNYGAVLQTIGLSRAVENLGAVSEVYNYQDRARAYFGITGKKKIKHYAYLMLSMMMGAGKKNRAFDNFRKLYIPLTKKRYYNNLELRQDPGDYDVYMTGSDQVWNPNVFAFDLSYFLDFVPRGKTKVAYGPSFGKACFNGEYQKKCGELLLDYKYISVREQSGVGVVKELCGKEATCVLDPTLLLSINEWKEYAVNASLKSQKFNGILCYIMPGDSKVETAIENIAQKLHKKTNLPIMRLGIKDVFKFKYPSGETDISAGPAEFLAYFLGAKYVVTNSFHGTAFSVNFKKNFYVPINMEIPKEKALHERIVSLLDLLNANNHIINANDVILPQSEFNDSDKIRTLLDVEVEKSKAFLREAIGVADDNK